MRKPRVEKFTIGDGVVVTETRRHGRLQKTVRILLLKRRGARLRMSKDCQAELDKLFGPPDAHGVSTTPSEAETIRRIVAEAAEFLEARGLPSEGWVIYWQLPDGRYELVERSKKPPSLAQVKALDGQGVATFDGFVNRAGFNELSDENLAARLIVLGRSILNLDTPREQAIGAALRFGMTWTRLADFRAGDAKFAQQGSVPKQTIIAQAVAAWAESKPGYSAQKLWDELPDDEPDEPNARELYLWCDGAVAYARHELRGVKTCRFRTFRGYVAHSK